MDGLSKLMSKSIQTTLLSTSQSSQLKFWKISILQEQWLFLRPRKIIYLVFQKVLVGAGGARDETQELEKVDKCSH